MFVFRFCPRFCPRLGYFLVLMSKIPLLWYLFLVEEPNNQYLHTIQEPGTQVLSKLRLCLCLDFVQVSVILVLRCPRALCVGTCLLSKSTLRSYVVVVHAPAVLVFFSYFLIKLRALQLILLQAEYFQYPSIATTSFYEHICSRIRSPPV